MSHLDEAAKHFSTYGGAEGRCVEYGYESVRPWFNGSTCLELGPADGQLTSLLRSDFRSVVSVDGSQAFVDGLRATHGETDEHKIVYSLFEDFEPATPFDTIVAARIMEHVDAPVPLYERMKRWLAPGGVLIVQVPNALSFHRLLGVKLGALASPYELNERDHLVGHQRVYDRAQLEGELTAAGWTIAGFRGMFLKFLSNAQMDEFFSSEMLDALDALGADFPENASMISVVARLP